MLEPTPLRKRPAGQSIHSVAPTPAVYSPELQLVQVSATTVEVLPASQSVHLVAPAAAY